MPNIRTLGSLILCATVLFVPLATAQNAQMVLLKDSDTDRLRADYKAYSDAKKKLEETEAKLKKDRESAKKQIVKKYKDIDWGDTELSKDFRIAIPFQKMHSLYLNPNVTYTPAVGTLSTIPVTSGDGITCLNTLGCETTLFVRGDGAWATPATPPPPTDDLVVAADPPQKE